MSYKPLHAECDKVALVTTEPTKQPSTATYGPRVPRHSIAISLTLAVVSYCCCSILGIIPIIMVVFAYVKREHGKAEEATKMSNYSRVVSGVVIALAVFLLFLSVLWFIGAAFVKYHQYMHEYGDDALYPDYNYYPDDRDDIVYPSDYYNEEYYPDDVTDTIEEIEDIIDQIDEFLTEAPEQYDTEPIPEDYNEY